MALTFDRRKNAINKRKHGISLDRAEDFDFESALYLVDDREDYGEARIRALGFLDARLYVLVFTQQEDDIRAISLRKATSHETKNYEQNT